MVRFSGNFQFCKPMKAREAVDILGTAASNLTYL